MSSPLFDPKRAWLIRGMERPRVVSDQRISRVTFQTCCQCDGVPVVTGVARTRQWQTIVDVAPVAERAAIAKTMQFGQHTDMVHHLRGLTPTALIKVAGVAAVVARAVDVTAAREAMNLLRLVTDLHEVSDEGLHLRCHLPRYCDVDVCSSRNRDETTGIAVRIERTSLWQYRSRNVMRTPHCAALDRPW